MNMSINNNIINIIITKKYYYSFLEWNYYNNSIQYVICDGLKHSRCRNGPPPKKTKKTEDSSWILELEWRTNSEENRLESKQLERPNPVWERILHLCDMWHP